MPGTQEELAIKGGSSAVNEGALQPWPQVAAADKAAVMGVLERGVLWGAAAPEAMALQEEWGGVRGRAPLPGDEQRHGGPAHGRGRSRTAR